MVNNNMINNPIPLCTIKPELICTDITFGRVFVVPVTSLDVCKQIFVDDIIMTSLVDRSLVLIITIMIIIIITVTIAMIREAS